MAAACGVIKPSTPTGFVRSTPAQSTFPTDVAICSDGSTIETVPMICPSSPAMLSTSFKAAWRTPIDIQFGVSASTKLGASKSWNGRYPTCSTEPKIVPVLLTCTSGNASWATVGDCLWAPITQIDASARTTMAVSSTLLAGLSTKASTGVVHTDCNCASRRLTAYPEPVRIVRTPPEAAPTGSSDRSVSATRRLADSAPDDASKVAHRQPPPQTRTNGRDRPSTTSAGACKTDDTVVVGVGVGAIVVHCTAPAGLTFSTKYP